MATATTAASRKSAAAPGQPVSKAPAAKTAARTYVLTPAADEMLLEIAGQIGVKAQGLVDLAVREWCTRWKAGQM